MSHVRYKTTVSLHIRILYNLYSDYSLQRSNTRTRISPTPACTPAGSVCAHSSDVTQTSSSTPGSASRDARGSPPLGRTHNTQAQERHTHTAQRQSSQAHPRASRRIQAMGRAAAPGRRSRARPRGSRSHTTCCEGLPPSAPRGTESAAGRQDSTSSGHRQRRRCATYEYGHRLSTAGGAHAAEVCTASRTCARLSTSAASPLPPRAVSTCRARDYRPRSRRARRAGRILSPARLKTRTGGRSA